jgi:hypothetical protein
LTLAGGKHIDPSFLALDPLLLSSASILVERDFQLQQRKTVISNLISSKKKGISFEHTIRHLSSDVTGLWPMSIEECQKEFLTLVKKIKEIEREDQGLLCKKELQFQMELKLMAGDKAGAKGIKNILKAEETKEMQ